MKYNLVLNKRTGKPMVIETMAERLTREQRYRDRDRLLSQLFGNRDSTPPFPAKNLTVLRGWS